MNKSWLYLVLIGLAATGVIIGWDVVATFTGFKKEFSFSINPIEDRLYGPVEDHLRGDPDFSRFQGGLSLVEQDDSSIADGFVDTSTLDSTISDDELFADDN